MVSLNDCLRKAAELVTGGNFGEAGKLIDEAKKLNAQIIAMAFGGSGRRTRPAIVEAALQPATSEFAATEGDPSQQIYSILAAFPDGMTRVELFAEMQKRAILPSWRGGTLQTRLNSWAGHGVVRIAENGKYQITGKQPDRARLRARAA